MKYIIDIPDNVKKIVYFHVGNANAVWTTSNNLDDLEMLTADYINEHFGELQDTAYQRGLEDTWEAAKKIAEMWTRIGNEELLAIFGIFERIGRSTIRSLFEKQTASEAIAKLKAYEEKQKADDEIKVGDEVINNTTGTKGILLEPETQNLLATIIVPSQRWQTFNLSHSNLTKTGKHYDIEKLLEVMRHD